MGNLYETTAIDPHDGLIATAFPPADVFHITVRKLSEAATLKRGSLLDLSSGTGGDSKYVIHGTTAGENETLTANCILAEDVEVGTASDVTALAYRTGHFVENKLILKTDATLAAGAKEALRDVGILLSDGFTVA
ncbi:MAG: hypothetical protein PHX79_02280 [Sphaerochaetaceae bacterium]|nr:hypothetical protein [Sphaerochaetaceae bacterium]